MRTLNEIMSTPTIIDGKRLLIVDEYPNWLNTKHSIIPVESRRTKGTVISGTYFWHATEPPLQVNGEFVR